MGSCMLLTSPLLSRLSLSLSAVVLARLCLSYSIRAFGDCLLADCTTGINFRPFHNVCNSCSTFSALSSSSSCRSFFSLKPSTSERFTSLFPADSAAAAFFFCSRSSLSLFMGASLRWNRSLTRCGHRALLGSSWAVGLRLQEAQGHQQHEPLNMRLPETLLDKVPCWSKRFRLRIRLFQLGSIDRPKAIPYFDRPHSTSHFLPTMTSPFVKVCG